MIAEISKIKRPAQWLNEKSSGSLPNLEEASSTGIYGAGVSYHKTRQGSRDDRPAASGQV